MATAASSELTLSVALDAGERVLALPPCASSVDVATIKMLIEAETSISASSLVLLYNNRVLTDAQTLGGVGVTNHAMLEARSSAAVRTAQQQARPIQAGGGPVPPAAAPASAALGRSTNQLGIPDSIMSDPVRVRDFIRGTPQLLFSIEAQNPELYRAIVGTDLPLFTRMWRQIAENIARAREAENERFRLANADPMDPEVQARIAEEIRLKNVQENYELAVEHNPEAFGTVVMLYVPMSVNGTKLQAFVDSGAQSTIMSVQCAERCGIMRLVDRRFAGVAKGVGSAKIHGRVHQVPCVIGKTHLSMSFTILENQGMDFLLGLDQLKNHQACIDLGKNVLRIVGEEIPFLAEKDLPGKGRFMESEGDESMMVNEDGSSSSSSAAASSASSSAAAAASSPAPAASSGAPLNTSGHNVAVPSTAVPSSQGSVATAAHRPAGALSASVPAPAPGQSPSPNPVAAANAAAVAAAQRRMAGANAASPPAAVAVPPAAAAAQSGRPALGQAAPAPSPFPESVVEQLTGLGFTRAESIQALTMCNGNAELAAGHLFNQ